MVAPKVFLTGATGYIGGDGLYNIVNAHPDWEITALVRNPDKAAQVESKYPKVKIVKGDLDSADIIEREVAEADIVFHFADCDHVAAATAIARGATHHPPERPLWLIHTSGTGILTYEDFRAKSWGIERSKEFNDWDGIEELTHLPDDALHRDVDKIILSAGERAPESVKTAIVCPPCINGPGRGPCNTKSVQVYTLTETVLKRKKGLLLGQGKNIWHYIHVQDLSNVYLALGEAAAAGGGDATWNDKGYYFAENGSFVWGDVQRAVAKAAFDKGLIPSPEVEPLSDEQIETLQPFGLYMWGSNSRGHAIRARKLLGWSPQKPKLFDIISDIVEVQAKSLGLL
ncbi:hypothetical protein MPDQ_002165 [Monascus purpureus]|uniref:NAD(P)-binding domain-containing protein n=1 Tax=Monascus purpureus TaxID=5098 RepID=A0A507QL40_MONPU|nr:hypothetical protein MPDQ_002165 [Monascus purpureus]